MINLAFTGTSKGMAIAQAKRVDKIIGRYQRQPPTVPLRSIHAIHGGCVGGDEQFHYICCERYVDEMEIWPSNIPTMRADLDEAVQEEIEFTIIHKPRPPIVRNHIMVDDADWLIGAPKSFQHELRSGTWATLRYAVAEAHTERVTIVWPDGTWWDKIKNLHEIGHVFG